MKFINQNFNINFNYKVIFTENIFSLENKNLFNILVNDLSKKNKIIVFIDKNVVLSHKLIINDIVCYFREFKDNLELVVDPIIIPGGERLKNRFLFLKLFYNYIEKYKICRQSYIISIGGGSLQDFIGYLASTSHRGVKLIRVPTTVLSQDDSGIGVKNGINYNNKKNFIGSFSVPYAVINDYNFLSSLSNNDFFAGFSEAIKVSLINDKNFFLYIEKNVDKLINKDKYVVNEIIYKCAKLHAEHISKNGDPFENLSSRPLDYGHWIAHKLESLSKYKINHGNAVALGILFDSTYSYFIGLLSNNNWKKIVYLIIKLGFKIFYEELLIKKNGNYLLFKGLEEFREHLGGKLTITLIKDIGCKIDIHHIDNFYYLKCIKFFKKLSYKVKHTC